MSLSSGSSSGHSMPSLVSMDKAKSKKELLGEGIDYKFYGVVFMGGVILVSLLYLIHLVRCSSACPTTCSSSSSSRPDRDSSTRRVHLI